MEIQEGNNELLPFISNKLSSSPMGFETSQVPKMNNTKEQFIAKATAYDN